MKTRTFMRSVISLALFTLPIYMAATVTNAPVETGAYKFDAPRTNDSIKFASTMKYVRTIYIDGKDGKDSNNGLSKQKPLKTLSALSKMELNYGDEILLKGGITYNGTIVLSNMNKAHTSKKQIHIGSYSGRKAVIDFKGYPSAIWICNSSNIIVSDLKLTGNGGPDNENFMYDSSSTVNNRYGIRILSDNTSDNSLIENITVFNVDIHDVFFMNDVKVSRACRQWDMKDDAGWGWGIFAQVKAGDGIRNVNIDHVTVDNVSHTGLKFIGGGKIDGTLNGNIDNLHIDNCTMFQTGGPGMQFNKTNHSYIKNSRITESGNSSDKRKWGRGSGMWTWGSNHFLLEHNIFEGAQGIADCCGAHIDFNCSNVVIQYCLSRYNCGGFIEILGRNYNCAYRYNVSINDGWRNLKDPAQKFWGGIGTPGCIFTVNGHNHDKQYQGPYQSYIYNNTVICTEKGNAPYTNPTVFDIATSNRGLVVMNNIFWFAKKATTSWSMHRWKNGKDYDAAHDFKISYAENTNNAKADNNGSFPSLVREMNEEELKNMDIVMKNNIYRQFNQSGNDRYSKVAMALPDGYWDDNALGGNPEFSNADGKEACDMIPGNTELISRGMPVVKLSSDKTSYGLFFGGLKVKKDFFGNDIKGDIIGAIVPNATRR